MNHWRKLDTFAYAYETFFPSHSARPYRLFTERRLGWV